MFRKDLDEQPQRFLDIVVKGVTINHPPRWVILDGWLGSAHSKLVLENIVAGYTRRELKLRHPRDESRSR